MRDADSSPRGASSDPDDVEVEGRSDAGEPRVVGSERKRWLAVTAPLEAGRQMDGVERTQ